MILFSKRLQGKPLPRLLKQWAEYFKTLDVRFEIRPMIVYRNRTAIPDFRFPDLNAFAEVSHGMFSPRKRQALEAITNHFHSDCLLLGGPPSFKTVEVVSGDDPGVFFPMPFKPGKPGSYFWNSGQPMTLTPEVCAWRFSLALKAIRAAEGVV